jgi:hypothetical protein
MENDAAIVENGRMAMLTTMGLDLSLCVCDSVAEALWPLANLLIRKSAMSCEPSHMRHGYPDEG